MILARKVGGVEAAEKKTFLELHPKLVNHKQRLLFIGRDGKKALCKSITMPKLRGLGVNKVKAVPKSPSTKDHIFLDVPESINRDLAEKGV